MYWAAYFNAAISPSVMPFAMTVKHARAINSSHVMWWMVFEASKRGRHNVSIPESAMDATWKLNHPQSCAVKCVAKWRVQQVQDSQTIDLLINAE